MSLDVGLLRRRSTRLRARDYSSPGHYFVTLCAHEHRMLFGDVVDGTMHLNDTGRAVESYWNEIPRHFPHAELDEFIVMPHHLHGIIRIVGNAWPATKTPVQAIGIPIIPGLIVPRPYGSDAATNVLDVGANNYSPLHVPHAGNRVRRMHPNNPRGTSRTIGSMIRGFKIGVTRWAREQGRVGDVWQRNYHDHIIRNERSLERVRRYIRNNPANWERDRNNPSRRPRPHHGGVSAANRRARTATSCR